MSRQYLQIPISGWFEAFEAHPSLGGGAKSATDANAAFVQQSEKEQAATQAGSAAVLQELAEWNEKYSEKFGHVFLLCALRG
jgi:2-oxo-4-hydroxy-4-carboxy--5-ureidoimidazoline (OHCU) decarboxylase